MAKTQYILTGFSQEGGFPFDFNGQKAIESSVEVNKSGFSGEGGTVSKSTFEDRQSVGSIFIAGIVNYQVNLITSKTYYYTSVTGGGSYTISVPSTIDIRFLWEPYVAPPPPPVSTPSGGVPSSLPAAPLSTEEEWEEYRIASGGFNIPYKDPVHIETQGNIVTKSPQPFQSPHIKDRAAALKIAKKLILDSQLNLEVSVPGSPYFVAELGDFARLIDPFNCIDSIERLKSISWNEKNQGMIFGFSAKEIV